ncbi:MAG: NosD domain-containing protein [Candidatus Bathyarchaeota archaeon]|jgi:parallel beta-helix repeat protein
MINVPLDYQTIQSAINAANPGDTIMVSSGTYYEHLSVNKTLHLIGEDKPPTIINGNRSDHTISILADNVVFEGFTVRDERGWLIHLDHTVNTTVANNIISGNSATSGILLNHSNYTRLLDNIIINNGHQDPHIPTGGGLMLQSSESNIIRGNNLTDNVVFGIFISESPNNLIIENFIRSVYSGVDITFSDNITLYHNILMSPEYYIEFSNTTWNDNYPSGGNYWSSYSGSDNNHGIFQNITGSDGIGDIPLDLRKSFPQSTIDPGNVDQYPLMGVLSTFQVLEEHQLQTLSNSTVSDFQFNGTAIKFNVTGEDSTTGFCRICIPTDLIGETFEVYVNGIEIIHTVIPLSNSTHSYLYFTYNHSTQKVIITPEFPSLLILLSCMTVSLLTVIFRRKKHSRIIF